MIVTISNEYGAGAVGIAKRVADELGYELVDQQLPVVVAKRLHIPLEDVEADEDTGADAGRAPPDRASNWRRRSWHRRRR